MRHVLVFFFFVVHLRRSTAWGVIATHSRVLLSLFPRCDFHFVFSAESRRKLKNTRHCISFYLFDKTALQSTQIIASVLRLVPSRVSPTVMLWSYRMCSWMKTKPRQRFFIALMFQGALNRSLLHTEQRDVSGYEGNEWTWWSRLPPNGLIVRGEILLVIVVEAI